MQGRLSPLVNGRIQAFPWLYWVSEFERAAEVGFRLIEWTLDEEFLYQNPLLTEAGRRLIRELTLEHRVTVDSLTCDFVMQSPFWKARGREKARRERDLMAVAEACHLADVSLIVIPLVDNGRLEDRRQEDLLVGALEHASGEFLDLGLSVVFESDLPPSDLARFIGQFDEAVFGINYDIGNSASLGFFPREELGAYGTRVRNVHVKDRLLGGGSVPLGDGCADFGSVFSELAQVGYKGNFILQTARSETGDHVEVLTRSRKMTESWIERYGV